jgi:ADP-ribosyl-[dinitrogen reductase] hydrolase
VKTEKIKDTIRGLILGDIAGVPYEFKKTTSKFVFMDYTMTNRTHASQPVGTWSDDTGLMLAAMDGICESSNSFIPDNTLVAINFLSWYCASEYMPYGEMFDVGVTTSNSLRDLFISAKKNKFWVKGDKGFLEFISSKDRWRKMGADSNGALMRILPHSLVMHSLSEVTQINKIKEATYITHPSMVCFLTCLFYTQVIHALLKAGSIDGLDIGQKHFLNTYEEFEGEFSNEWIEQLQSRGVGRWTPNLRFELQSLMTDRMRDTRTLVGFSNTFDSVGALRLAIWAVANSSSFEEVIEKCILAKGDTDTVAAIAGSMAGAIFDIPDKWWRKVPKRKYLEEMVYLFSSKINDRSAEM